MTYAVVGDQLAYWNFFPAPESWGIVPVWGHARVATSRHPDIAVGERVYGCLPMASHLIAQPGKVAPDGFRDMAAHRQPMSPIYNQYRRLAADPAHDPAREDARMLFAPLFTTSFLIGDQLAPRRLAYGAGTLIVTSASSKTAMAAALCRAGGQPRRAADRADRCRQRRLRRRAPACMTRSSPMMRSTGWRCQGSAVLVDFAGNGELLHALYEQLPGQLAYVLRVGVTHHDERGETGSCPGPAPVWFFAPDAATALIGEIGPDAFNAALAERWAGLRRRGRDLGDRREGRRCRGAAAGVARTGGRPRLAAKGLCAEAPEPLTNRR